MTHRQHAHITRTPRGWSVHTVQHWLGWPNPAETFSGERTLAWAVYTVARWCASNNTTLAELTVNGKPIEAKTFRRAILDSTSGTLEYTRESALAVLG